MKERTLLRRIWVGDSTAFHGGQVTLNPIPHIQREPVGMVIVPILSYVFAHWMMGWASAPYDPTGNSVILVAPHGWRSLGPPLISRWRSSPESRFMSEWLREFFNHPSRPTSRTSRKQRYPELLDLPLLF